MIRVLIADDEAMTRDILKNYIPWKDLGADEVLEAEDGIQAFSLAVDNRPDLLLVDIRMPGMDGIQLIDQLKTHLPDSRMVIISGHSDKEYLKSAIRLKVADFIDKPLQLDSLIDIMRKLIDEIQHERSSILFRQEFIQNRAVRQLCNGTFQKEELQRDLSHVGVDFQETQPCRCVIIKIVQLKACPQKEMIKTDGYLEMFHHLLNSTGLTTLVGREGDTIILLYASIRKEDDLLVVDFLNRFFDEIEEISGESISAMATVGLKVPGVFQMKHSYATAIQAGEQSFVAGKKSIVTFKPAGMGLAVLDDARVDQFRQMLLHAERIKAGLWLKTLIDEMRGQERVTAEEARYRLLKVLSILHDTLNGMRVPIQDLDLPGRMTETATAPTLNQVESSLKQTLEVVMDRIIAKINANPLDLRVHKIIQNYLSDTDLGIRFLADRLYLSPAHLCTVFKQETGKTISQVITEMRMEEAHRLLLNHPYNNSELAAKVGYQDAKYFSKVFERYYGMKPRKLRENTP